jgi:hypothetical protein
VELRIPPNWCQPLTVVERDEDISVQLPDGSRVSASLAGRDPGTDLALLKLTGAGLAAAETAAAPARIGQLALALGRPSKEGIQASLGVVSALGGPVRTGNGGLLEKYLRTDAIPTRVWRPAGRCNRPRWLTLTTRCSLTIPVSLAWQVAAPDQHGSVQRGFAIQPAGLD